ncbi:MAG: VOC family protein [Pseudomonadota bacterium]
MKLTLHHVNVATDNVGRMDTFYADVLGLPEEEAENRPKREMNKGFDGAVTFRHDGDTQFHLAQKDMELGIRTGNFVNPLHEGHIAFRTDDIEAFKRHLEAKKIPYSDYGHVAAAEWHQIFFYDPDGNVIEVHQVKE